ncbi:putative hscarg dehydrogenase [Thozetella sp. PMI_491]|nr:putative hscarg dehydrogenase [Thozetella sp. PMI_491]
MSKIIAVVGATGTQGGSVARTFAKIPGWEVRGITRNPDAPAARKLEALGVKVVKGDLGDVDSLKSAFQDASAIFGVTDFWQFVQQPSTQELAKSKGITWNEACYLQELEHGKNIIDAASQVVANGKLERLVLSTLSDAKKASKGKYTWVYHFDAKARFVQYLEEKAQEDQPYKLLHEKTSYVQIGNYLDNWMKNPIFTPQKVQAFEIWDINSDSTNEQQESDGTFAFRYITSGSAAVETNHPTPFVHPPHDTGLFVEGLILKAPPRTTMLGTCSLMLFSDYVALWGKLNNVQTKLLPITLEEIAAMFPGGFGLEVGETVCYINEFGWDGGEGAVLPEQAGVDKAALTDVASYIRETDWSSVLA